MSLVFPSGVRQLAALPVGACDQFGGLALQFVLREGAAKSFEHIRGGLPVLQPDQRARLRRTRPSHGMLDVGAAVRILRKWSAAAR